MKKHTLVIAILVMMGLVLQISVQAQQLPELDSIKMLMTDATIEMEATFGIDNMYNFNFDVAEGQFRWLKKKYPDHPLPSFLLGLSNWWKIMPDIDNTKYDLLFLTYMDASIAYAEVLEKQAQSEVEGAFFLSAGYAFKARLYAERSQWRKSAVAGKRALKYLEQCKGKGYLSPELLFGDGLYNYYSVWIPENYPALKPLLVFFSKGDKAKGIEQLEEVCQEAFYTRVEAYMYLMRIYAIEEKQPLKALHMAKYLHTTYPNNPYFHRFYARMLFVTGNRADLFGVATDMLTRIDSGWVGYEATSGRYAAYFLGYWHESNRQLEKAIPYYKRAIEYAEEVEAFGSGYYQACLSELATYHEKRGEMEKAKSYYDRLLEHSDKKKKYYDEAKSFKKAYKKEKRKSRRNAP